MANRAEKRREKRQGGSGGGGVSSNRLAWILGIVALLAVAIVAWNLLSTMSDGTARTMVQIEYDSPQELIEMAQGVSKGNPDAAITVMEFGDYQCPACQAFYLQAEPFLNLSYVDPGLVHFVFYDFPLEEAHPNAIVAARSARCAGDQGAYWEYHDQLYQNQGTWGFQADPVSEFVGYARDLGLDANTFRSCVRSDRHAEVVAANHQLGVQLGVPSTPTILIDVGDDRAVRVQNWGTDLRPILDEALAAAAGAAPADSAVTDGEPMDAPVSDSAGAEVTDP